MPWIEKSKKRWNLRQMLYYTFCICLFLAVFARPLRAILDSVMTENSLGQDCAGAFFDAYRHIPWLMGFEVKYHIANCPRMDPGDASGLLVVFSLIFSGMFSLWLHIVALIQFAKLLDHIREKYVTHPN